MVPNFFAEYEFPSSLTSRERAFVHNLVSQYGLKSKSHGKGVNRSLTVYKEGKSTVMATEADLTLTPHSTQTAHLLLLNAPLTQQARWIAFEFWRAFRKIPVAQLPPHPRRAL